MPGLAAACKARPATPAPFNGAPVPCATKKADCAELQTSTALHPQNCSPNKVVTLFKHNDDPANPNYPDCYFYLDGNPPNWGTQNALLVACILAGEIAGNIDQGSLANLTGGFLDELCALLDGKATVGDGNTISGPAAEATCSATTTATTTWTSSGTSTSSAATSISVGSSTSTSIGTTSSYSATATSGPH